ASRTRERRRIVRPPHGLTGARVGEHQELICLQFEREIAIDERVVGPELFAAVQLIASVKPQEADGSIVVEPHPHPPRMRWRARGCNHENKRTPPPPAFSLFFPRPPPSPPPIASTPPFLKEGK